MSDSENPAPEVQEPQQEGAVGEDNANGSVAPTTEEAPQAEGETQETQNVTQSEADGGEDKPAEEATAGDGAGEAAGAGGDDAQKEGSGSDASEEERQPTPAAVKSEEEQEQAEPEAAAEEPAVEEEKAPKEEEEQPEPEPEPQPEPEPEPEPEIPAEPTVQLSEEKIKRLEHYFNRKAVDGRLDLRGFKVLCRLMGEVLSAEDADKMFDEGDRDNNGTIDFDEYCRLYAKHSEEENARKAVMTASIDKLFPSNDGKPVELKKVKNLLLKLQRPDLDGRLVREKSDLNPADIHHLVMSMDKDGNGLISKQEFVDTLCKHLDHH